MTTSTDVSWPLYHVGVMMFAVAGALVKGWHEGAKLADISNNQAAEAEQASASQAVEKDETKKPLPKPPSALLRRDPIAFPTLGVLVVSLSVWVGVCVAFVKGLLQSPWLAIALNTTACYWAFTVAHDACHGAVAPKYPKINALIGQLACIPLLAPFTLLKQVHLTHHRHSGDDGSAPDGSSLDPDAWAGEGPTVLLPLRWATVYMHYIRFWTKGLSWRTHASKTMKDADRRLFHELLTAIALVATLAVYSHYYVHPTAFSVCVLWPQLLGLTWLMYFFDYVPHRPHKVSYKEDPFRSTNATSFLGSLDGTLWTSFCMAQNLHIVHHLWPSVPFYKYRALWRHHQAELVASGVRVAPVFVGGDRAAKSLFPELTDTREKDTHRKSQ